jgi:hypothetical protein
VLGLLSGGPAAAQICLPGADAVQAAAAFELRSGGATVLDTRTGLEWQRCPEGFVLHDAGTPQASGDDLCIAQASTSFDWGAGLRHAEAVNTPVGETTSNGLPGQGGAHGASDWRVPNLKELASLAYLQCREPALNLQVFPAVPGTTWFWSASPTVPPPDGGNVVVGVDYVWAVDFSDGSDLRIGKTGTLHLRLVRDGS